MKKKIHQGASKNWIAAPNGLFWKVKKQGAGNYYCKKTRLKKMKGHFESFVLCGYLRKYELKTVWLSFKKTSLNKYIKVVIFYVLS